MAGTDTQLSGPKTEVGGIGRPADTSDGSDRSSSVRAGFEVMMKQKESDIEHI